MAKELFAGQKKNKYRIVISKKAVSKKNLETRGPLILAFIV